jgi:hypothetical protein
VFSIFLTKKIRAWQRNQFPKKLELLMSEFNQTQADESAESFDVFESDEIKAYKQRLLQMPTEDFEAFKLKLREKLITEAERRVQDFSDYSILLAGILSAHWRFWLVLIPTLLLVVGSAASGVTSFNNYWAFIVPPVSSSFTWVSAIIQATITYSERVNGALVSTKNALIRVEGEKLELGKPQLGSSYGRMMESLPGFGRIVAVRELAAEVRPANDADVALAVEDNLLAPSGSSLTTSYGATR